MGKRYISQTLSDDDIHGLYAKAKEAGINTKGVTIWAYSPSDPNDTRTEKERTQRWKEGGKWHKYTSPLSKLDIVLKRIECDKETAEQISSITENINFIAYV